MLTVWISWSSTVDLSHTTCYCHACEAHPCPNPHPHSRGRGAITRTPHPLGTGGAPSSKGAGASATGGGAGEQGAPRPRTPTPPRPANRTAEARNSTTQTATHRPEADHPRDHRDDDSGHRQSNTARTPRWIRDDSPTRTEPRPRRQPSAADTAARATPASTKPAEEHA